MANTVDTTIEKKALDQVDQLIIKLTAADEALLKVSASALAASRNITNIKTPGDLKSNAVSNANVVAETNKQSVAISNLNTKLVAHAAQQRQVIKNDRDQSVAKQILRAETDRNFRANTLLGGAYAKASAQLLILKKNIKDTAIAFGEESVQVKRLQAEFAGLDGRIRAADKVAGDFQRNVGNYSGGIAKGFGAIFSSVKQLAYILPGLGVAGIIGFATEPIIEYISKLDLFKKTLSGLAEAQKAYKDAAIESQKSTVEELNSLKANLEIARDVNLSYKERNIAVDNLIQQYPFYFENLTREQILAGETAAAEKELTLAILARARANAIVAKITENEAKVIDLQTEKIKLERELQAAIISRNAATANANKADLQRGEGNAFRAVQAIGSVEELQKKVLKNQKEINQANAFSEQLTKRALVDQKEAIGLDYKKEKSVKQKTESQKREDIQLSSTLEQNKSFLQVLEEQVRIFTEAQKEVSDTSQEYKNFQNVIDGLRQSINLITDPSKVLKVDVSGLEKTKKEIEYTEKSLEKMKEILNSFTDQFSEGFFSKAGLPTLFKIFRDEIKGFGVDASATALASLEAFQELYNFLNSASKKNFELEYERLAAQNRVALEFAGQNDVAKAEIERQGEERRKEIQVRELKAQKEIAKFNIAIDTAQAVISAFANPGGPAGVALAALAVVVGAVQLAAVNAQQIPQFWKGGETPGGVVMVNDNPGGVKGNNYKEVIQTPSGKVIKPQGRNVLMNLPKGSQVFPDYNSWEQHLNSMLYGNGIDPLRSVMNYEAKQSNNSFPIDAFNQTASRIENAVSSIPGISLSETGFKKWNRSQGQRTIVMNDRMSRRGKTNP